jgi:hypothetical protein
MNRPMKRRRKLKLGEANSSGHEGIEHHGQLSVVEVHGTAKSGKVFFSGVRVSRAEAKQNPGQTNWVASGKRWHSR